MNSGEVLNGILCQDLERTTFQDNAFDLIITEEVFEHIPSPERACIELRRILKPGGYHISTIAVYWNQEKSVVRAIMEEGVVRHLLEPIYHGDPNRPDGALVFVDFGADIVEKYLSLTGETEVFWSNGNEYDERNYAVFNNMVFVSKKLA